VTITAGDERSAAGLLIDTAGHVVAERARLVAGGRWEALREDVERFLAECSQPDGDGIAVRLDYLIALAVR
jgi:hypothetical protein